jgi:hypothetical protein
MSSATPANEGGSMLLTLAQPSSTVRLLKYRYQTGRGFVSYTTWMLSVRIDACSASL